MDENKKIFSDKALIGFAVLVGPIAFLYGALKNSKYTADKKLRKTQVIAAFIPIIIFILSVIFVSDYSISIGWLWTGTAIYFIQKYFKPETERYRSAGLKFINGIKAGLTLGVISWAIILCYLSGYYLYFKSSIPTLSVVDYLRIAFIPNSFEVEKYDKLSEEFSKNEIADQAIIKEMPNAEGERLLTIAEEDYTLWVRNAEISKEILAIKGLPSSLAKYEELASSYSQYRREEAKAIVDNINDPNEENYNRIYLMRSRSEEVQLELERLR